EVRKGIFLALVEQAIEYPEDPFFLVVDEINRANLPRVFGELLYALEYRGAEHNFRLPYSGGESHVPRNITIIATMNTADRSISAMSDSRRSGRRTSSRCCASTSSPSVRRSPGCATCSSSRHDRGIRARRA